jgi:hypothetical protein
MPIKPCLLRLASNCHDKRIFSVSFLVLIVSLAILLASLQIKMETYRHSTGPQFNVTFK